MDLVLPSQKTEEIDYASCSPALHIYYCWLNLREALHLTFITRTA